jgi:hypothetical protein
MVSDVTKQKGRAIPVVGVEVERIVKDAPAPIGDGDRKSETP